MAEFLNTRETSKEIKNILTEAKEFVVFVSPYIHINQKLKEDIFCKKGINITLVFGKKNMKEEELNFLKVCKNVSILFHKDLHAKIYMNEKNCIISSMNLYEYSEINNIEASVIVDKNEKAYKDISKQIDKLLEKSEIIQFSEEIKKFTKNIGYCIRTGVKIDFNPKRPFCYEAYQSWAIFENENYKEKFCHYSGEPSNGKTSFSNPILKKYL
ncbi:phospholipase D-like domain-containing protein [Flavobacterium soli]|uniref:phospholipase D-like domain-containing protein n=1 Tax=Flavobacterium soli TaxID=344881 RepID=UPI0003F902DA|nr:phospholipase D-like domain-containing protein [Flavobacterium soli]